MKKLTVYGTSDDLIEFDGIEGADEFYPHGFSGRLMGAFEVYDAETRMGLQIYAIYDMCWHFSIGQLDENKPLPDWPIKFSSHLNGYSTFLEIDVPDTTRMKQLYAPND